VSERYTKLKEAYTLLSKEHGDNGNASDLSEDLSITKTKLDEKILLVTELTI
jgi:hypothetical protein